MSTETKLMGYKDPVSGQLTDIKRYTHAEYNGTANLVDLSAWPTGNGPWSYDAGSKTAIAPVCSLSLSVSDINVDASGIGTVDVTLSGPTNAVVDATFTGQIPINALQYTLTGGNATVSLEQGKGIRSNDPVKVMFKLNDGSEPGCAHLTVNLI